MGRHRQLTVKDDAKVTRGVDHRDRRGENGHICDANLLQLLPASEPHDLRLAGIQTVLQLSSYILMTTVYTKRSLPKVRPPAVELPCANEFLMTWLA
jgi:hypothetical protein